MEETPIELNYNKGDLVICVINSRASLTIGKEYTVIESYGQLSTDIQEVWSRYKNEITLVIKNDEGNIEWYDHMRFLPKSEFRKYIIDEILNK